jgi:ABC-type transport system involved in cytochrome bd biosynthesis fused ATPase/permease subunit
MLELHNVTIGQQIRSLSMALSDGQLVNITGQKGSGKTTLLRALLGFIPVDGGHISIDGELLTPMSAPYFRRQMAYVPQHLTLPEGYHGVSTDYLELLRKAVDSGKTLLIVDEPSKELSAEDQQTVDGILMEAVQRGAMVVAVNSRFMQNQVSL